mmetsp:Transcript_95308/g.308748  ORF Transcript_95308/g.308748 Transcript_95308/m.308748 type:complete len:209 (+) Transcript_95308:80-706(+)
MARLGVASLAGSATAVDLCTRGARGACGVGVRVVCIGCASAGVMGPARVLVAAALSGWLSGLAGAQQDFDGSVPLYLWLPGETRQRFLDMCKEENVTIHEMLERWSLARGGLWEERAAGPKFSLPSAPGGHEASRNATWELGAAPASMKAAASEGVAQAELEERGRGVRGGVPQEAHIGRGERDRRLEGAGSRRRRNRGRWQASGGGP